MSGWVSLADERLLVSLRVPQGWELLPPEDDATLRLEAPETGTVPRLTFYLQRARPDGEGHGWFEELVDAVPGQLASEVVGFELLGTDRYRLSSADADVFTVLARRSGDGRPPTSQLQAWVWAGSTRMFVAGGSTAPERESEDLPLLAQVLGSLRLLPPRPA